MEFIPHILYINLDKRKDRLIQINDELKKMGLSGERIAGINTLPYGFIGCATSHINALKLARERKWENVLIFEDDFQFVVDKETFINHINYFFKTIKEYDVLMLSYNVMKYTQIDNIVSRTTNVQSASGYVVHNRFYDRLIDCLEEGLSKLIKTKNSSKYTNDQYWKNLQSDSLWFIFNQRMGIQRPTFSDIEYKYVNYRV